MASPPRKRRKAQPFWLCAAIRLGSADKVVDHSPNQKFWLTAIDECSVRSQANPRYVVTKEGVEWDPHEGDGFELYPSWPKHPYLSQARRHAKVVKPLSCAVRLETTVTVR